MLSLQKSLKNLIEQRSQIWKNYDDALVNYNDLTRRFSQKFDSSDTVNEPAISTLTSENSPPTEVRAVIAHLETIESQIAQANFNIQQAETEIQTLKKQAFKLITILSALGVVALLILVIYLKNQPKNNNNSSQVVPSLKG